MKIEKKLETRVKVVKVVMVVVTVVGTAAVK
jgi:hypothetical protein